MLRSAPDQRVASSIEQGPHIGGGDPQIGRHRDFDHARPKRSISGSPVSPRRKIVGERVADEFAGAQLALRWTRFLHRLTLTSRKATQRRKRRTLAAHDVLTQGPLHLFDAEALDDVAGAHVLVVLEGHAAFLADLHFARLRP